MVHTKHPCDLVWLLVFVVFGCSVTTVVIRGESAMKSSRLQFGLFALLLIPSLVVVTNWLALSWTRTEDWTYFVQKSPGVIEEETSAVRLMGWPISYNVAFPSESRSATFRILSWSATSRDSGCMMSHATRQLNSHSPTYTSTSSASASLRVTSRRKSSRKTP